LNLPQDIDLEKPCAFVDGSSTGMYGYCLYPEKETFIIKENTKITNNVAEWLALYALIMDLPHGWTGTVYSDSLLIVNQFAGQFRIKDLELKRIHDSSKMLCNNKQLTLNVVWVPREKNILGKKLERELAKERKKRWNLTKNQKHSL